MTRAQWCFHFYDPFSLLLFSSHMFLKFMFVSFLSFFSSLQQIASFFFCRAICSGFAKYCCNANKWASKKRTILLLPRAHRWARAVTLPRTIHNFVCGCCILGIICFMYRMFSLRHKPYIFSFPFSEKQ